MHLRAKERKPGNEVAILNTVFTVKNWVPSCYVTGKNLDLASARFPIHSVFKNFHFGEQLQKVADSFAAWIHRIRVDGAFVCFLFLVPKKNSGIELYD